MIHLYEKGITQTGLTNVEEEIHGHILQLLITQLGIHIDPKKEYDPMEHKDYLSKEDYENAKKISEALAALQTLGIQVEKPAKAKDSEEGHGQDHGHDKGHENTEHGTKTRIEMTEDRRKNLDAVLAIANTEIKKIEEKAAAKGAAAKEEKPAAHKPAPKAAPKADHADDHGHGHAPKKDEGHGHH